MALSFPNPSRSFDAAGDCVQFWGYDDAIEVAFFIDADALRKLCPAIGHVELGILKAFDATQSQIHAVAARVYRRGAKGTYSYRLSAHDF